MNRTSMVGLIIALLAGATCFGLWRWHVRQGNDFLATVFAIPTFLLLMIAALIYFGS